MKNMFTKKGFTLIEILIVVAIIGILASVVVVGLGPAQRKGRDSRRLSDLRSVQNALELYYGKIGHYPDQADVTSWDTLVTKLTTADIGTKQIPNDPATGKSYAYATDEDGTGYVLAAVLEEPSEVIMSSSLKAANFPTGYIFYSLADGLTATNCGEVARKLYCLSL